MFRDHKKMATDRTRLQKFEDMRQYRKRQYNRDDKGMDVNKFSFFPYGSAVVTVLVLAMYLLVAHSHTHLQLAFA